MAKPIEIYRLLLKRFGFLNWWPGETSFEVLVGAILTQQTSWKNVEKAIASLKKEQCLSLECLASINIKSLEKLIRPSGYYKQKARRLKDICSSIKDEYGSIDKLFSLDAQALRKKLLSYKGIGNETADSIVLYAANKPIFVIDAYTKRIMRRINKMPIDISYDSLQEYFEKNVKRDLELYKDMHAQFVELGKSYCKTIPLCDNCPANNICAYYESARSAKQARHA
ncbi:MAG: endonuclease [Candidatus Marsarchaeota archaeon]|jgi:endonuclease-3 related protein|nr:endonuclease [Candidatus Marsarchaeota archaeon]MCL5419226.1 endonuclease [Candidatus Marsarchaeota archaeon]